MRVAQGADHAALFRHNMILRCEESQHLLYVVDATRWRILVRGLEASGGNNQTTLLFRGRFDDVTERVATSLHRYVYFGYSMQSLGLRADIGLPSAGELIPRSLRGKAHLMPRMARR